MSEPDPGYPPHWEADVVASDGGTVHLRPITPHDAAALEGLHARSSERTRYLRFFGPYPRVPERDLIRFTTVDYRDRVALVVVLGHDIIAVGRYERIEATDEAEVAFLVEDAHQSRGLGSVLLEHLAAAARERGLRRFSAEVLAENGQMVRVFQDAGYTATRSFDQGVVHLEFPIAPTESSVAVAYEREQRSESRSVARLLTPMSVAVIGASNDTAKVGHAVLRNLLGYGFAGPIYPINPEAQEVAGVPAYPSVLDVPADIDLAVLAVPAAAVSLVLDQCRHKRVRGLVVVTGGFGERDEQELVAMARSQGMRVIGPNCLGIVNTDPAVRLNASLAHTVPGRGRVGCFCQSGALGVALLQTALSVELGLSTFVSAGNRADVSGNDLLQFWATDPATEVVLLHLESFGNPRKFARLARRLARIKPVIAVKSGRHAPGANPHSVALPESSVQALFDSAGVVRVETVAQMFDVATLLAHQPLPRGARIAVVGNSRALGLLVADACAEHGLELTSPPVDVGSAGTAADFAAALRAAVAEESADALVTVFVPPLAASGEEVARVLAEVTEGWGKPVVSTFLATEGIPEQLQRRGADGEVLRGSIPSYPSPERAVLALARACRYAEWRDRPVGNFPALSGIDAGAARALVAAVLAATPEGRHLDDEETSTLLAAYGITVVPTRRCATARDAPAGVATVVGVVDDPSFGALVSFGVGGVATDLLGDRAYRTLPVSDLDAAGMIRAVRAWPLLDGYRGAEPVDVAALEDLVLRVARLADDLPEILGLDLEPVIVAAEGLSVAGASARVGPPTARVAPGPRRLP